MLLLYCVLLVLYWAADNSLLLCRTEQHVADTPTGTYLPRWRNTGWKSKKMLREYTAVTYTPSTAVTN